MSRTNFPLAGDAVDGWSNTEEATATCFCGAVQLSFPIKGPGLIMTFACHCADCHKVCQMAAANFVVGDDSVKYLRGRADLATFTTGRTTTTGNDMTNYFCRACGTLMNRVSSGLPGRSILRTGTVDDFELQNTVLRPRHEIFTANRASWLAAIEGAEQHEGRPDWGSKL